MIKKNWGCNGKLVTGVFIQCEFLPGGAALIENKNNTSLGIKVASTIFKRELIVQADYSVCE